MGPRLPAEAKEALRSLLARDGAELRARAVDWVIRESVDLQGRRPRGETVDLVERSFAAWQDYLLVDDYGPLEEFIAQVVSYRGAHDFHVSTPQRGLLSFKKAVRPCLDTERASLRLQLVDALDEAYERVLFQLSDAYQEEVIRQHVALTTRAENTREAQTAFLANIGHEVRTPLSSLLGFAELIEGTSGSVPAEELAGYMLNLKDNARQLLELVDDLVDLSRLESAHVAPQAEDLDLWRLITDVHEDLRAQASAQKLEYTLSIRDDLPRYARTDPMRLARSLRCALRAAIRLSRRAGHVQVRVRQQRSGWLEATIDDNGQVDLPTRQQWFDGLLQAPDQRGSGPGLAIAVSSRLAQVLGGALSVAGHPGSFRWTLEVPLQELQDVGSTAEVAPEAAPPLRHVLVVGDERTPNGVLQDFFATAGISSAFSPHHALASADTADVVLADTNSDARSLGAIAAQPHLKDIPVVVATACAAGHRSHLLQAGAYEVIAKPLDLDELMTALLSAAAAPGPS